MYWKIQKKLLLPSIKEMAAIFAIDTVQDSIISCMCPSRGYMCIQGMVFTPATLRPKFNDFSRCPSSYRRSIMLCFLLIMVSVPGLLLVDMIESQVVTQLLSTT